MNEYKVCCVCNENKRFLGRINGGKNYYCNSCISKINKSGIDYWKDCSFEKFLESISNDRSKKQYSEHPMADGMRRTLAKMGIKDTKKNTFKKRKIK